MSASIKCLIVDLPALNSANFALKWGKTLSIRFADIPTGMPPRSELELVVAPLFGPDFDAVDLIEVLGAVRYRGNVRILAPSLPNRGAVLRELRSHAGRRGIVVDLDEPA